MTYDGKHPAVPSTMAYDSITKAIKELERARRFIVLASKAEDKAIKENENHD